MKKLFIIPFLWVSCLAYCQKTWTGAAGSNWNNAGSWDPAGVPTSTDDVFIGSCSTCPQLGANASTNNINIDNGGNLNIGSYTLNVNGFVSMNGGNLIANNGIVDAQRVSAFVFNTFTGNWTLRINMAGTNNYLGSMGGGNTFNNDFTLEVNTTYTSPEGSGLTTFQVATSFGDTYKGKTVLKNVGQGWLMVASNSTSNTVFEDDVEFVNANTTEGKMQIGEFGGKITCNKKCKLIDVSTSPYSYIYLTEALFKDEVMIDTKRAAVSIGKQNSTVFKKTLSIANRTDATVALGSGTGGVLFEPAADLLFTEPMKKGQLLLQLFDFQSDANTPPLNLIMDASTADTDRPNTLIRLGHWGTFDRVLNIEADYVQYNMVTFNKNTTIKRTGITGITPSGFFGEGICPGNSIFNGTIEFNNAYGDDWILGTHNPDTYKQNATFKQANHPWGVLRPSYSANTTYEGNVTVEMTTNGNGIVWGENNGISTLIAGKTLTISCTGVGFMNLSNFKQLGASTQHNIMGNALTLSFDKCEFQAPIVTNTARLMMSGSSFFNGKFTKTGSGIDNSIGENTFWKKVNIKNASTTGEVRFLSPNSKVVKYP